MSRRLVIGDVHGAYRALEQVLDRCNFDPSNDHVVFLGDVCDGWSEVPQSIRLLQEIGAEAVWGNHDEWTWEWMQTGVVDKHWFFQGGEATLDAMGSDHRDARKAYGGYFVDLEDYIYDPERNHLYVHGGIPPAFRHTELLPTRGNLTWDRTLFQDALAHHAMQNGEGPLTRYAKVFVGHTQTNPYHTEPIEAGGVVLLDQGAGWDGRLSIMDADTGEFWQSEVVVNLYPNEKGRFD